LKKLIVKLVLDVLSLYVSFLMILIWHLYRLRSFETSVLVPDGSFERNVICYFSHVLVPGKSGVLKFVLTPTNSGVTAQTSLEFLDIYLSCPLIESLITRGIV
jgi:hypothetical protein